MLQCQVLQAGAAAWRMKITYSGSRQFLYIRMCYVCRIASDHRIMLFYCDIVSDQYQWYAINWTLASILTRSSTIAVIADRTADRQTDGRTDGRQDDANSRSYCVAVRSAEKLFFNFYRAMQRRALRCYATLCYMSSVGPYVFSPSEMLRYRYHIGWNISKIFSRLHNLLYMLGVTPKSAIWSNGNIPKIRVE